MTTPTGRGAATASAALRRITWYLDENANPTLTELAERLDHLGGTKAELRAAIASLAAQLWATNRDSEQARSRDALLALTNIENQVASWREKDSRRQVV